VSTTGDVAKELGFKKVLVVTDENVEKMGHSQKSIDSLNEAGIETVLFNRCEMDAPDYTVQAGADLAKSEAIDGIVGIGCTSYVANEGLRFLCPVPATEELISESLAKIYDCYQ